MPSLAPQHSQRLKQSAGISDAVIAAREYETATNKTQLASLGYSRGQCIVPAMVIPIFDAHGNRAGVQIRPDRPRLDGRGRTVKYDSPPKCRPVIDVSPAARRLVDDSNQPLVITEGVIKADAATSRDIPCVSVAGVYSWSKDDPFWTAVPLVNRPVYLAFDSDQSTNPNVQAAARRLHAELKRRGAVPKVLCLPPAEGGKKQGLDDFLAAGNTLEDLLGLPTLEALAIKEEETGGKGCYRATSRGLVREIEREDGVTEIPLTNFTARITTDLEIDNGSDTRHEFEVTVELDGQVKVIQVPADEFERMNWVVPMLGAKAIIQAGMVTRDHARAAIQSVSGSIRQRKIYEHLGWVNVQGQWIFLHAGGRIGTDPGQRDRAAGYLSDGDNPLAEKGLQSGSPISPILNELCDSDGVGVRIPAALKNYHLPEPVSGQELKEAVEFTLQLLTAVAPPHLTFILLAATFRIAVDTADFSLHLVGSTNVGKTVLVALFAQFFGPDLHDRNLPGSWMSTSNQLLAIAALAKNVIFPVDDYVPAGSQADIDRAHRDADRVFRSLGNQTGRGRCNRDGTPKEGRSPQCLIVSTGEDVPDGRSLNSRLLALEVKDGDVLSPARFPTLSLAQHEARNGLFARVMASFLAWLAPCYEWERATLHEQKAKFREQFRARNRLARTVDIAADLLAGFDMFLDFCEQEAGLSERRREQLWEQMHDALYFILDQQDEVTQEADPVSRYLTLLVSAMATGLAHLKPRSGTEPQQNQTLWGWKLVPRRVDDIDEDGTHSSHVDTYYVSQGVQVGWVDYDHVYLDIAASLAVVQKLAKDSSLRPLPLTQRTLGKSLAARGYLSNNSGDHYTSKLYIGGAQKRVLHLHESKLIEFAYYQQPDPKSLETLLESVC
jgi:hypothetical protein